MSQVKLGDKNIPFIYQGSELLYPNPVKDGLVLWYDFKGMKNSDASKNVARDLSGKGNNGTLQNFAYTSGSGYKNKGLKFDGIDDRLTPIIKHPDNTVGTLDMKKINNGQKFSVEMTLKMTEELITQCSEIFMTNRTYGRFWLQFVKDSAISNEFVITASTYYGTEGSRSVLTYSKIEGYKYGDEFHLCVTLDKNDKIKLYVNGVKKGEQPLNDIIITTPQETELLTFLGQGTTGAYYRRFDHELYSVKVYDRVLTDQEIQHNYKLEKERWGL